MKSVGSSSSLDKKTKKVDPDAEFKPKSSVNYAMVSDTKLEDARFIRERNTWKKPVTTEQPMSSTFDALIRMEVGSFFLRPHPPPCLFFSSSPLTHVHLYAITGRSRWPYSCREDAGPEQTNMGTIRERQRR